MSLRPAEIAPVPAGTARVAAAAFPKSCPAMRMRDELGAIYDGCTFAPLYPARGQPAHPPWRLALVTVLQFAGGLSDRRAGDAVRGRIERPRPPTSCAWTPGRAAGREPPRAPRVSSASWPPERAGGFANGIRS